MGNIAKTPLCGPSAASSIAQYSIRLYEQTVQVRDSTKSAAAFIEKPCVVPHYLEMVYVAHTSMVFTHKQML